MIAAERKYAPDMLRPFLRYESLTGALFWAVRAAGTCYADYLITESAAKSFNARFSGQRADRSASGRYRRVQLFGVNFHAHRIVWALDSGAWPDGCVDHINGNAGDNTVRNLRIVNHQQNCVNRPLRSDSPTTHLGVRFLTKRGRWEARIGVCGRLIHLGVFGSFDEAVAARKAAEQENGFHPNHGRSA